MREKIKEEEKREKMKQEKQKQKIRDLIKQYQDLYGGQQTQLLQTLKIDPNMIKQEANLDNTFDREVISPAAQAKTPLKSLSSKPNQL